MRQPILKIGFTRLSDAEVEDRADTILDMMTGNPLYATPNPTLADVTIARDAFSQVKTQRGRIPNYSSLKKQRRMELNAMLKALGEYVRDEYPGNVVNWQTSGYEVQTFEGDVHPPLKPVIKTVRDGQFPTQIEVGYGESQYALWYEGQLLDDGVVVPMPEPITTKKLKMIFTGLEKGKEYSFRVRAHGTKGVSAWSQPVYRVSQ